MFESFQSAPVMGASQTCTLAPERLPSRPATTKRFSLSSLRRDSSARSRESSWHDAGRVLGEAGGLDPDATPDAETPQKWNGSRSNILRMGATYLSFLVMGANDAAYGPLIPYLMRYYDVSHTIVSLVFLSPFLGYVASALLNNWLHLTCGQRGIALVVSACHLTAYLVICLHPPYPVLVLAFILAGFGNGMANAAWNAWIGNLARASELLGLLHALYGAGGVVSPLIATAFITKLELPWYAFYYFMMGLAALEGVGIVTAFWEMDGAAYREQHQASGTESEGGLREALFRMPVARVAWSCAAFLLGYAGIEVALGGWIVLFMIDVRNGDEFSSGLSAMGFWLGLTLGRAALGFATGRVGVKVSTAAYIVAAVALQLVFWLVPSFYVSAVAVALQGFFLGPLYPAVVLVASRILPRHQHVVVIGFAAAFGGCGGALLPFVTGLLASGAGVGVLQPIILALLVAVLVVWLCLPRMNKKKE